MKAGKNTKHNQLQALLKRHTAALEQEARESNGRMDENRFREVERLARLVEVQRLLQPKARPVRWPLIVALLITVAIASLLLFARVSSTEIEMDVTLSEVNFNLPLQQMITEEMNLASLGVSGTSEIQFPQASPGSEINSGQPEEDNSALRLTPSLGNTEAGSVTLAPLMLPAKTHINIKASEVAGQYRLTMSGTLLNLQAGVMGQVHAGRLGIAEQQLNYRSPRSVVFKSDEKNIDLDLKLLPGTTSRFSRQVHIDSINLFSVEQHVDGNQTVVRLISSILSGSLFFESLAGKEQNLRSGQQLRFKSSKGEIRTLELKDDHISFAFHGIVEGMTSGDEKNEISLMPTYLEWLSARHGLSLLWGTTIYFFGLIYAVFKWWGEKS